MYQAGSTPILTSETQRKRRTAKPKQGETVRRGKYWARGRHETQYAWYAVARRMGRYHDHGRGPDLVMKVLAERAKRYGNPVRGGAASIARDLAEHRNGREYSVRGVQKILAALTEAGYIEVLYPHRGGRLAGSSAAVGLKGRALEYVVPGPQNTHHPSVFRPENGLRSLRGKPLTPQGSEVTKYEPEFVPGESSSLQGRRRLAQCRPLEKRDDEDVVAAATTAVSPEGDESLNPSKRTALARLAAARAAGPPLPDAPPGAEYSGGGEVSSVDAERRGRIIAARLARAP